jgi:hypothetical protein
MEINIRRLIELSGKPKILVLRDIYRELEAATSADLNNRMSRLKRRLKRQGVLAKNRGAITKLDVINDDKSLRVVFEGIINQNLARFETTYAPVIAFTAAT